MKKSINSKDWLIFSMEWKTIYIIIPSKKKKKLMWKTTFDMKGVCIEF